MSVLGLVLVLAAQAAPAAASFERVPLRDGERLDVTTDGAILDLAFGRRADGSKILYLLTGPAERDRTRSRESTNPCRVTEPGQKEGTEGGRRIIRVSPFRSEDPSVVAASLANDASHLSAFDLDGDGTDELIVGSTGRLDVWEIPEDDTATPTSVTLIETPGTIFLSQFGRPSGPRPNGRYHVLQVGTISSFGPSDQEPGWNLLGTATLPLDARVRDRSAWLRTLPFVVVGSSEKGGDILASDPESMGEERLRTWRVEPEGPHGEALECWARLPGPERRIDADFVVLDGEPALVVTTTRADKLEIFGEKRIRVFSLKPDRSRTGFPPFLAVETGANLWQPVGAIGKDVDGDSRDELMLTYWKGLRDEEVVFELLDRHRDGRWSGKVTRKSLDVPDGDRSFLSYRDDLDGDGATDLLVSGKGGLRIHLGRDARRGLPVGKKPAAVLDLPVGMERLGDSWIGMGPRGLEGGSSVVGVSLPRAVDFDGDGIAEVVLRHRQRTDELAIYRWNAGEGN